MSNTEDITRYRFTKYVQTALERKRNAYLQKEYKRNQAEELMAPEDLLNLAPLLLEHEEKNGSQEREHQMSWDAKEIRSYLAEQAGRVWEGRLSVLTDRELLILYAKIFRGLDFEEIGAIMGIDGKQAASSYAYARKKMKKERKKNGI